MKASYVALWLRAGVETQDISVPLLPVSLISLSRFGLGDLLNSAAQK